MSPKIIATIGPASKNKNVLRQMALAGLSVARINFSHGRYEDIRRYCAKIKQISKELHKKILILADLQGPKIRIGKFSSDRITLKDGQNFILTSSQITGNSKIVSVDYKELPEHLLPEDKIFLDDGKIELKVLKIKGKNILCKVIAGSELSARKGVTVFRKKLPLPAVTDEDRIDAEFAVKKCGITHFAQSFVRKPEDVLELRSFLKSISPKKNYFIIAKIEDYEGYTNIDKIIKIADGIMIARGDLGVTVERALVPLIQKEIIEKCNKAGIQEIVATQMLESMITNYIPTRAEVNDVAVAVMQEADYLMLSAETAVGKYPVKVVNEMNNIIKTVTKYLYSHTKGIM